MEEKNNTKSVYSRIISAIAAGGLLAAGTTLGCTPLQRTPSSGAYGGRMPATIGTAIGLHQYAERTLEEAKQDGSITTAELAGLARLAETLRVELGNPDKTLELQKEVDNTPVGESIQEDRQNIADVINKFYKNAKVEGTNAPYTLFFIMKEQNGEEETYRGTTRPFYLAKEENGVMKPVTLTGAELEKVVATLTDENGSALNLVKLALTARDGYEALADGKHTTLRKRAVLLNAGSLGAFIEALGEGNYALAELGGKSYSENDITDLTDGDMGNGEATGLAIMLGTSKAVYNLPEESQAAPTENTPADNAPAENAPAGNAPAGNAAPAENAPAENAPAGNTPSGNAPAGNAAPAENAPADN